MLGFDPRGEHVGGDFEVEAVKFALAGEVDNGFALEAAIDKGVELFELGFIELGVVVCQQPGAVAAEYEG